jgi:hypothetical protein
MANLERIGQLVRSSEMTGKELILAGWRSN